jgi:hypothetical protein
MRHNPDRGIMGQLVETGAVVVDLVAERGLRRDANEVLRRIVKRPLAADTEVRQRGGDQRLGDRDRLALHGRRSDLVRRRQALALRQVEDGEPLEERHRTGLAALARGALLLLFGDEAVGEDDDGPLLAAPHLPARRLGLAIGQPILGRKAVLDGRVPQQEDVDARIAAAGGAVARQAQGGRARACPGLNPGKAARFELGDDPSRDLLIEVAAKTQGGRLGPGPGLGLGLRLGLRLGRFGRAGRRTGRAHEGPPSPPKARILSPERGVGGEERREGPQERALAPEGPERKWRTGREAGCRRSRRA